MLWHGSAVAASAGLDVAAQPPRSAGALPYVALLPRLLAVRRCGPRGAAGSGLLLGLSAAGPVGAWISSALTALGAGPARATLGLGLVAHATHGLAWAAVGGIVLLGRRSRPGVFVGLTLVAIGAVTRRCRP